MLAGLFVGIIFKQPRRVIVSKARDKRNMKTAKRIQAIILDAKAEGKDLRYARGCAYLMANDNPVAMHVADALLDDIYGDSE